MVLFVLQVLVSKETSLWQRNEYKPNKLKKMSKEQLELLKKAIQDVCYDYLIDELSEDYQTLETDLYNNIKEKLQ